MNSITRTIDLVNYFDKWTDNKTIYKIIDKCDSDRREIMFKWLSEDPLHLIENEVHWALKFRKQYISSFSQARSKLISQVDVECYIAIRYMNKWSVRTLPFETLYGQKYIEGVLWYLHCEKISIPTDIQVRISDYLNNTIKNRISPYTAFCLDLYEEMRLKLDENIDVEEFDFVDAFRDRINFILSSYWNYEQFMRKYSYRYYNVFTTPF